MSRGQLLAEMDDTQARSLLRGAEAAMTQAADALQRYGLLHDNGSLPEVQWVEIESKVAQAKAQLEVARKHVSDCRLVAPVGGVVGKKMVGAGETAMPSQTVVTILDIDKVKVKVAVPEEEMNKVSADSPSAVSVDAAGVVTRGGHIEKGVVADAMTHTYDVRIVVDNAEHKLLPGMVANVDLSLDAGHAVQGTSVIVVPIYAVRQRADGSLFVWTVGQDNSAHRATVAVGRSVGNNIVVDSGLSDGQRIVTEGYQKLSEGTRVSF